MTEYFSNIKDILQGAQFRSFNPVYGQLINDWDELLGKKFSGKTQFADIVNKGGKTFLVINVASSPLVQELQFFKRNLIKKIKEKYSLEISDIVVKVASKKQEIPADLKQNEVLEVFDERPTELELENIELEAQVVAQIKANVEKQTTLTEFQKSRMLKVILDDLKTQEWMKAKGFPVCEKCGRVMTRKTFGADNVCHICKNIE